MGVAVAYARNLRSTWIGIVTALLAACTTLPGDARVEGHDGSERALFRGVAYPLPEHESMPQPRVRYIFHIHGMGITKRDEIHQDLYGLLAEKYPTREPNARWYPARLPNPVTVRAEGLDCKPWRDHLDEDGELGGVVEKPCYFDSFGTFRVDVFRNGRGDEEVRLYTYFWHRDLWRIQEPHLRKDMQRNTGRAPLLNTFLKRQIVDGGLSDASAYAGPAGDLVRAGIGSVLCIMARDAAGLGFEPEAARSLSTCGDGLRTGPDVEFSYVTHSLGSRMLFDVLAPRDDAAKLAEAKRPETARGFLIDRGRTVFMAANQLPLLALGHVSLSGDPAGEATALAAEAPPPPPAPLMGLLEAKRALERAPAGRSRGAPPKDSLQVVAFVDPDDILGFRASDAYSGQVEFVDITHRNASQFLWLFTPPHEAHDQELRRADTRQMILCGARVESSGRVKPYECRPPV